MTDDPDRQADLDFIGGLLESGAIRPVVDAVFPLEEIVAAHRRVAVQHAAHRLGRDAGDTRDVVDGGHPVLPSRRPASPPRLLHGR